MYILENINFLLERLSGITGILFNKVFILGVSAQFFSMVTKGLIKSAKTGKFSLKKMSDYGGMPSSHTAFIISTVLGVGIETDKGFSSPIFALAFVVALIVLVDAVKFRGNVDKINANLSDVINDSELKEKLKNPKFIAHKSEEVIAGALFAVIYTFIFYALFNNLFS